MFSTHSSSQLSQPVLHPPDPIRGAPQLRSTEHPKSVKMWRDMPRTEGGMLGGNKAADPSTQAPHEPKSGGKTWRHRSAASSWNSSRYFPTATGILLINDTPPLLPPPPSTLQTSGWRLKQMCCFLSRKFNSHHATDMDKNHQMKEMFEVNPLKVLLWSLFCASVNKTHGFLAARHQPTSPRSYETAWEINIK